ncbi:hypothetical protein FHU36_007504 [Nonomuraea muscovyensis]|uniref:Lipoprotein n=1 Tax=Nonomuraea muscovyensis TaxID=1124761 RepID=A0A7X0C9S2_9ACTN|nr:hypothetical protein [Nonomuraea muscovyensis]MBB6350932.1 hypothetical protein [Nonomuraea muscovyensis]
MMRTKEKGVGRTGCRGLAVVLLGASLILSGCVSNRHQVDPAVLKDVRSIGKVIAEATSEGVVDRGVDVVNTVVVDIGAKKEGDALNEAVRILERHGWRISADNRPTLVSMDSSKWVNAYLAVRPYNPAYFEYVPKALERIKQSSTKEESVVSVEAAASN